MGGARLCCADHRRSRHGRTLAYNFSSPLPAEMAQAHRPAICFVCERHSDMACNAPYVHLQSACGRFRVTCMIIERSNLWRHTFRRLQLRKNRTPSTYPSWLAHSESQSLKRAVQASGSAKWRHCGQQQYCCHHCLHRRAGHPMGSNQNHSDRPVIPTQAHKHATALLSPLQVTDAGA